MYILFELVEYEYGIGSIWKYASLFLIFCRDTPIEECDGCINEIIEYGSLYVYPEDDFALEYFLKHEGYCLDPALGLGPRQQAECQHFLTGFITPAMNALYNAYAANAQNICHFWYQKCPGE